MRNRYRTGLALVVVIAVGAALTRGFAHGEAAAFDPVEEYRPPDSTIAGTVLTIENHGPQEWLLVAGDWRGPARLVFAGDQGAAPLSPTRAVWPDREMGRLHVIGGEGAIESTLDGAPSGGRPLAAPLFALAADGDIWAVEGDGAVLRFRDGRAHSWRDSAVVAVQSAAGAGFAGARTIHEFRLAPVADGDPLVWITDRTGRTVRTVGEVAVGPHGVLGQLHNAGWVTGGADGTVFFAFALEPELRRYDSEGRLVWRSRWPLASPPAEPRLSAPDGVLRPLFTPVQLGIARGPDGRLYVLAVGGDGPTSRQLLVFDEAGTLLRQGSVDAEAAIFADDGGRVRARPVSSLRTSEDRSRRLAFEPFVLPALDGRDSIRLAALRGNVVVLNFWASWCGPCRREMPQLDVLAKQLAGEDVAIVGLNDDVDPEAARRFVAELGIDYPSARGGGELASQYGYRGLPYTVILDRELRVVRAMYGFGATAAPIEQAVLDELSRP